MHGCICALLHDANERSRVEDKMKKKTLTISVAAVAAAGSAAAADLPRGPAPYYHRLHQASKTGQVSTPVSILAMNGPRSPVAVSTPLASRVAASLGTTGRLDNSCLAPKQTSKSVQPTTLSHHGNFPIPGSAPCGVEQGTRCWRSRLRQSQSRSLRHRRKQDPRWLDCRAWNGSRLHAELVGQGWSICTWISAVASIRLLAPTMDCRQAI